MMMIIGDKVEKVEGAEEKYEEDAMRVVVSAVFIGHGLEPCMKGLEAYGVLLAAGWCVCGWREGCRPKVRNSCTTPMHCHDDDARSTSLSRSVYCSL